MRRGNVLRHRGEPRGERPEASRVEVYRKGEDGELILVRTEFVRWDSSAKYGGNDFSRGNPHPGAAFKVVRTEYADGTEEIPSMND